MSRKEKTLFVRYLRMFFLTFALALLFATPACSPPCTLTPNGDKTTTLRCGDQTHTIANGKDGTNGQNGQSCALSNNPDGTATLRCDDGKEYKITSGKDGTDGKSCSLKDQPDGTALITCGTESFTVHRGQEKDLFGVPQKIFESLPEGLHLFLFKEDGSFQKVFDKSKDTLDLSKPHLVVVVLERSWNPYYTLPKASSTRTCIQDTECPASGVCRIKKTCKSDNDCQLFRSLCKINPGEQEGFCEKNCLFNEDCEADGAVCNGGICDKGVCSSCASNNDCPTGTSCRNSICEGEINTNLIAYNASNVACEGTTEKAKNEFCKNNSLELCDTTLNRCAHTRLARVELAEFSHQWASFLVLPYRRVLWRVYDACVQSRYFYSRKVPRDTLERLFWRAFGDNQGNIEYVLTIPVLETQTNMRYELKAKMTLGDYSQRCF